MAQVLLSVATLALMVFALVSIITAIDVRYLPKFGWVLLVVFLPLIGSILWFVLGTERSAREEVVSFGDPRRRENLPHSSTENDLAAVEREIEFHEKQAEIRRLEAQLKARRSGSPDA